MNSLKGGGPELHSLENTVVLMVAAVLAGYTLTGAHPKFLKLFEHPFAQFIIFYIIGITWYAGKTPPGGWGAMGVNTLWAGPYVFLDAVLIVVLIQSIVYFSHKHYGK